MKRLAIFGMTLLFSSFVLACGDDDSSDKEDGVKVDAPGVDVNAGALTAAGKGAAAPSSK